MMRRATYVPDGVPVLSRGRHRNPRRGACFMEMASYLAGERWSDHPACTHPLLATIARCVNDLVDDETRQRLTPMIADVIGVRPDDERVAATLVRRCAQAAVPVAAQERQNVLAVALLAAETTLEPGVSAGGPLSERTQAVFATAPGSERWARGFMREHGTSHQPLNVRSAPRMAALAVESIAHACVADSSDRLVALLHECIDEARALMPVVDEPAAPVVVAQPAPERSTTV